ncbi:hypothetical protein [Virgibacillus sp. L01]|uniref:hypothetical protein n=1 Tax=Virgibacillus sp. L01 TaxID=3457429 RepID=UPI003FD2936E
MPDNRDTNNGDQDPHFDGAKESIISDPTGKQIGIQTGKNRQYANPNDAHSLKQTREQEGLNKH